MKIAVLIGANDVGGAEFVSYQHVLMIYRNQIDLIVISGTKGKFYELIKKEEIHVEVVGMNPNAETIEPLIAGCQIVFNSNFFDITSVVIQLKQKLRFKYFTIIHTNINLMHELLTPFDTYTDGYYAIHEKIVESFTSRNHFEKQKFTIIPNCVDVSLVDSFKKERKFIRKHFGYKANDFVIGMVSRIAPDKNIIDAIKIFENLPTELNAKLLIIGGTVANSSDSLTYYLKVLKAIAKVKSKFNADTITLTGNVSTNQVYRFIRAMDLGLNCSPSEGLPIALLEMMAAGIPCIMPAIGDIPNVLGGRGIVIPIRQRLEISEIFAQPCYSNLEIDLFTIGITDLSQKKDKLKYFGNVSRKYIREFRSLEIQEKRFLNFLLA